MSIQTIVVKVLVYASTKEPGTSVIFARVGRADETENAPQGDEDDSDGRQAAGRLLVRRRLVVKCSAREARFLALAILWTRISVCDDLLDRR
jgi:hypothetical protein